MELILYWNRRGFVDSLRRCLRMGITICNAMSVSCHLANAQDYTDLSVVRANECQSARWRSGKNNCQRYRLAGCA